MHCKKPELRHVRNGEGTYCYSVCCNCGSMVDLRKYYFATEDVSVVGAEEWMQEEDPDAEEIPEDE